VDVATLLGWYEQMVVIRGTEKGAHDLFLRGLVKGTTHLAAGHEAVAVGASAALRPDDYVFATYRGHHHAIARGATPEGCLAELMQRRTGVCRAKGGSMHLTQADHGMLGSYAIVGAHLPMAAGAAWSAQLRGTGQVAVAFFGDGATNIGAFHEALNLASVWKLPVLFVCENNLYGEYSRIDRTTPFEDLAERAKAYAMRTCAVDGQDVDAVMRATGEAAALARSAVREPLHEPRAQTVPRRHHDRDAEKSARESGHPHERSRQPQCDPGRHGRPQLDDGDRGDTEAAQHRVHAQNTATWITIR
jgi:pyruvate dehydrogenase E1 component alpha subunit